jgi:hypothetical protein
MPPPILFAADFRLSDECAGRRCNDIAADTEPLPRFNQFFFGKCSDKFAVFVFVEFSKPDFSSGSNVKTFVIRCGTPDCDWGYKMHDTGGDQSRLWYAEFRKHCIQRDDLREWDTTSDVHLNLEYWMLTLIKT